jgi:2',3'-cyclic-nucleotide 2'-phosphodiesterase/3'-nucleotidase
MRRFGLALALALACAGAPLRAVTLTILHTSDLHGRVHPHDALEDRDLGEGLARIAAAVAAIRAEGHPTLLLDSGDTIQGAPSQALAFAGKAGDGSDPIVRTMNRIGYDAMAVGNHEFDFGTERLEKSRREAAFPFLSANVVAADGRPAFDAYAVRVVGDVRIGILGLTTTRVFAGSPPAAPGVRFTDPVAAARRFVPILRAKERCDLVVVIAHQGFAPGFQPGAPVPGARDEEAYVLATEVSGIDLLLAGHTHTLVEPGRVGKTWVSEPGRWGNTLTRFDVTLTRSGERWTVTDISGRNLPMRGVAPDARTVEAVQAEQDATMRALGEVLARLDAPASASGVRSRDTGQLDWLHAVQLAGSADLSFCSFQPRDPSDWPAGPLTARQVWAFYPYEDRVVTVRATGRQVRAALEHATDCLADPNALLFNCDTLEGAEYVLDLSRPRGRRVISLTRRGRAIADEDSFTVALNSFRATGAGGYAMWVKAPRLTSGGNIRELLGADARRRGHLRLEADGNWRVVAAR